MELNQNFRVNSSQVVCETIDGEVVIVNLEKGYYYSLLKTGADVWSGIERRIDRQSLIEEMTQTYHGRTEEIAAAVDEFLDQLQHEELIVVGSASAPAPPRSASPTHSEPIEKPGFEKPVLEKFTDMEDLLLLDPIHEVDMEAGWPSAKIA